MVGEIMEFSPGRHVFFWNLLDYSAFPIIFRSFPGLGTGKNIAGTATSICPIFRIDYYSLLILFLIE